MISSTTVALVAASVAAQSSRNVTQAAATCVNLAPAATDLFVDTYLLKAAVAILILCIPIGAIFPVHCGGADKSVGDRLLSACMTPIIAACAMSFLFAAALGVRFILS